MVPQFDDLAALRPSGKNFGLHQFTTSRYSDTEGVVTIFRPLYSAAIALYYYQLQDNIMVHLMRAGYLISFKVRSSLTKLACNMCVTSFKKPSESVGVANKNL